MQTNNSNQGQETQSQNPNSELETNFLEFGKPQNGKHTLAIIKEPDQKRGRVAAHIFINYEGDPKKAVYVAKDNEGNELFPPSDKLWQLKQSIKQNAPSLLEQVRLLKNKIKESPVRKETAMMLKEEAKEMGKEVLHEAHGFASTAKDDLHGTNRPGELKSVRNRNSQKIKSTEIER